MFDAAVSYVLNTEHNQAAVIFGPRLPPSSSLLEQSDAVAFAVQFLDVFFKGINHI